MKTVRTGTTNTSYYLSLLLLSSSSPSFRRSVHRSYTAILLSLPLSLRRCKPEPNSIIVEQEIMRFQVGFQTIAALKVKTSAPANTEWNVSILIFRVGVPPPPWSSPSTHQHQQNDILILQYYYHRIESYSKTHLSTTSNNNNQL